MPFDEFREACEGDAEYAGWREGQIAYPARLDVQQGGSELYNVVLDVGQRPLPPDRAIAAESPTGERLLVRCYIGARLEAVGQSLTVEPNVDEGRIVDGWTLRNFGPTGVAEWTWEVSAKSPGANESVVLKVRPSILIEDRQAGNITGEASFITNVTIESSWLQDVAHWFDNDFKQIVNISNAIIIAVLGFMGYLVLGKQDFLRLRKKIAGRGAGQATAMPSQRGSPKGRRQKARR